MPLKFKVEIYRREIYRAWIHFSRKAICRDFARDKLECNLKCDQRVFDFRPFWNFFCQVHFMQYQSKNIICFHDWKIYFNYFVTNIDFPYFQEEFFLNFYESDGNIKFSHYLLIYCDKNSTIKENYNSNNNIYPKNLIWILNLYPSHIPFF